MDAPETQSTAARSGWAAILVGLAALAVYNAGYFFPFTVDDAFITLRYAWNLAHGAGLTFNPGDRVEGFSNPSWTLWAALLLKLGIEPLVGLKWTGMALSAATTALTAWTARQVGVGRVGSLIAAFVVATDINLAFWSVDGLETPLWTAAVVGTLGLCARRWTVGEQVPWSAMALFGLYVTRPEAPIWLAAAMAGEAAWLLSRRAEWRRSAAWLATVGVGVLAVLGARYAYFHDWVANTYYVKAADGWGYTLLGNYGSSWLVTSSPVTGLLLLPAVIVGMLRRESRWVVGAVAAHMLFMARAGSDWMAQNRLWVAAVPVTAVLFVAAAEMAPARARRWVQAALFAALAWQGWRHLEHQSLYSKGDDTFTEPRWKSGQKTVLRRVAGPLWVGVPDLVADVLNRIPDGDAIAHTEVGLLAYITDNPVVDVYGLCDARLSGATGEPLAKVVETMAPPTWILEKRPTGVVAAMRKTSWYKEKNYKVQAEFARSKLEGAEPPRALTDAEAWTRLTRGTDRMPRVLNFHRARVALARAQGDTARLTEACDALRAALPEDVGTLCDGGAASPPVAADAPPGASWTPTDWAPVGASTVDWEIVDGGVHVRGSGLVCAAPQPGSGLVEVRAHLRTQGIVAASDAPNLGAAITLKFAKPDGSQASPVLGAWTGTVDGKDVKLHATLPDTTQLKVCVGLRSASGEAWFNAVEVGEQAR